MPQCIIRIRPNTLISLWYSLLCGLLQVWLLFLGFERYRLYTEMQWPTGAFPGLWLSIYASLLGSCIPLLALFLAFGLLKLGNLASDSEKLGARRRRTIQMVKGGMGQQAARRRHSFGYRLCHCFRSLWTHCPPSAQSAHLLLAIVQLFAQQIMIAQLYRFGFINSGDFLNTELDFLFHRARQLATNLPMGETRLQSFRITSEELAASPLAPNLLPILMHARLFGISLEFVNLLIALIAFSAAYPAVFWRASRPFSSIFSLFLLLHSANIVFTYLGFSVLFRIQETNFYSPRPVGMGQHLWALRQFPLFHPIALVGTFWLCLALQQFAPIALYAFGYAKFVASQSRLRLSRRFPSALPEGCSLGGGDSFCDGLTPHVFAITLLLLVAAAKAPAFYALGVLYYKEDRVFLLCCVMADLMYMFIWVLLWCLLTLKCQWRFRVHYDVQELISLQDAHKMADGNIERQRTPAELKNALLLIHGENLFLTDDPIAKPVIMRQVLRNCGAPAQTEGVGESAPLWLRSAAGGCQSLPGTQSPQRRTLNRPNGAPATFLRTPELGRQFLGRQQQNQRESPPVPLAAPPYQRMASLPPLIDGGGLPMPTNSFGTLQAKPRTASANEYASFIGPRPALLPHQNPQMPVANGGGTLSRSFNAAAVNQQQIVQNLPAALYFPENYASIHRRCSKSSVGGGSAASTGFLGPASMGSPHLLRADRANSLAPSDGNERRKAEMMAMNGGMGKQQQFEAMSQRDQQRLFDGLAAEQQQQRPRLTTLNGENGGELIKRIDIQIQAQKGGERQGPIGNSFAAPSAALNGVWQQEMSSLIEGGSLNGTTPTGSVTVGSSRVGSAASACSTSQATSFEQPIRLQNGFNGGMGAPFGQSDYGTLTREGELTLKGANQRSKIVEKKGQWNGVKLGTESEYATSVV